MTNHLKQEIKINNNIIEYVDEYIYLGQIISPQQQTQKEIKRRISVSWKKYWAMKEIMKNPGLRIKEKRKVYNTCILPCMTYGCQTWSLTKKDTKDLETCQHNMERSILNIKKLDKIRLKEIRRRTNINDITIKIKRLKWRWAGHIFRDKKDKWTKQISEWYPREGKRKRGRQVRRWEDDLGIVGGSIWRRKATDRK
jgi:hypothetical protein